MKIARSLACIILAGIFLLPGISYSAEEELPIFPSPVLPEGFSQEKSSILRLHGKKPADMVVFVRTLFRVLLKDIETVGTTQADIYYPIQTKENTYNVDIPLQMQYGNVVLLLDRISISVTNVHKYYASDFEDRETPTHTATPFLTVYPTKKEKIPNSSIIKTLSDNLDVMCYSDIFGEKLLMSCYMPGQSTTNAFVPAASLDNDHSMEMNFTFMGQLTRGVDEFPKEIK